LIANGKNGRIGRVAQSPAVEVDKVEGDSFSRLNMEEPDVPEDLYRLDLVIFNTAQSMVTGLIGPRGVSVPRLAVEVRGTVPDHAPIHLLNTTEPTVLDILWS
jgi:hypothetical protein